MHYKFDEYHIADCYFIGRLHASNTFYAFDITQDIRTHQFIELKPNKEASTSEGRQICSCIDINNKYLALSDNSYLCIFNIDPITDHDIHH